MKKNLQVLVIGCMLAITSSCYSQVGPRYLSEIFTAVTVSTNITYGNNISVLTGTPASSPLIMDVYQPTGDVLTARPLIIVLHAGSFLPSVASGLAIGKRTDSAVVEMCKRFARRGYVAVAADYRLGWNPLSTNQDVRTGTILNAVYRGIQDAKNCVRFFRNDAANANVYKIDVNRIAVGGFAAGGYLAMAYGSLNKAAELQLTKFVDFSQSPPAPYVNQAVSGNFDGTDATALNTPNYATQSSTINVAFSLAGAAGDSSWIEAGEIPIICVAAYKDPYAPYKTGPVIVSATGQFVVQASGGYDVARRSARLGNQAIFQTSIFNDVYTTKANANSAGIPGLYTLLTPTPGPNMSCTGANANAQIEQSAPWDWWNEPVFVASYNAYTSTSNGTIAACKLRLENPDMSATKGKTYMDTIQGFLNPRLVCAMNLAGCVSGVGLHELSAEANLSIYPNPATTEINYVLSDGNTLKKIDLFDATGRLVLSLGNLSTGKFTLNRNELKPGLYLTTIELGNKTVLNKKIIID
ncbi:MAG: T9SS type A sorting domain-containing protein [bacterium]|nr:T9SS type A sorting domain-containing protein [bacterium]